MEATVFLHVNSLKNMSIQSKRLNKAKSISLGNNSKDITTDNMKKAQLKCCIYGFSVDYNAIDDSDIIVIYKYLMKNII